MKKIRVEGKKIIVSILVLTGTPVVGCAHIPQQVRKVEPEVVRYYCPWQNYRYNPQISKKDMYMSEMRKQEILQKISGIRQQIRAKAELKWSKEYQDDEAYYKAKDERRTYLANKFINKVVNCVTEAKQIV